MKRSLLGAAILAAGLVTASCVDNDERTSQFNESYIQCFNAVTDLQTGVTTLDYTPGPKYTFDCYQEGKNAYLKVSMVNVNIGDDVSYRAFNLPQMPMIISSNARTPYRAKGTDIIPENPNMSQTVKFNTVDISILRRIIYTDGLQTQQYSPVYTVAYTVNNRYAVNVIPKRSFFFTSGKSVESDATEQTPGLGTSPQAYIALDPEKMTAKIDLTDLLMIPGVKAINMSLPDIPFTVATEGKVTAESAATIIPVADGQAMTSYPVDNLTCTFSPNGGGELSFTCTPGANGVKYNVNLRLLELSL